ncbi:MAG: sigma-70 family RNA polymerase sigma factor [Acidobacteria bacterium]|nr:MAG: sigma-70 family RNA polymerase sigma factor [Acidobacteriota bacterium]
MPGRSNPHDVTLLLQAWRGGDAAALERLMPVVYQELHRLAHRYMQHERAGHVLQTTALVNEAYLCLLEVKKVNWQDRTHFFAICAKLMRQILVHIARAQGAKKRGAHAVEVTFDEAAVEGSEPNFNFLALDEALQTLEEIEPRKARVVELRFFGGMTTEEVAEALGISSDTVLRDWNFAKLWLWRAMEYGQTNQS